MRILFIHPNAPAQFGQLIHYLSQQPGCEVAVLSKKTDLSIPGVRSVCYTPSRLPHPKIHPYIIPMESAVLEGQAAYRAVAVELKAKGFIPDIIYGHSGWGPTLYMKDLFPDTPLVCYFEWYYHARGTDADYGATQQMTPDEELRIRTKNTRLLIDLYSCDLGISPTYWQQSQFPPEYAQKIKVIHDGVDTFYHKPNPGYRLVLPSLGIDLSEVPEIVTYATRGMEHYRGFPQFMEAVSILQKRRPQCHFVIGGEDRVCYGRNLPDGKTFKQLMLETLPLDLSRIHFTGALPRNLYLQVLQASSVHVYLTVPFVLSWSLMEAMSTGCLVVGADTPPVKEVINDGVNGLLVDMLSPLKIADRIEEALEERGRMKAIRVRARETILDRYDLSLLMPRQIKLLSAVAAGCRPQM